MRNTDDGTSLVLPGLRHFESEPEAAPGAASGYERELVKRLHEAETGWERAVADLAHQRRHFDRESNRLLSAQKEEMLRDWLEVVDNMDRALTDEPTGAHPWYEGMKAIRAQMLDLLRRHNVEPMHPYGEQFDPHRHEAVGTTRSDSLPSGIVAEVLQTGYIIDERVLREAKVIVAD